MAGDDWRSVLVVARSRVTDVRALHAVHGSASRRVFCDYVLDVIDHASTRIHRDTSVKSL